MDPIIGAIAEGTFHETPNLPMLSVLTSTTSLPKDLPTPDGPQPSTSTVDPASVDDASQRDGSIANNPMSDAAINQATPEPLVSTSHLKAPAERAQSLTIPSASASAPAANTQVRQTDGSSHIGSPTILHGAPTSPAASGQGPPVQLSPKTAPATSAHGVLQQPGSPSMQAGLPVVSTAGDQPLSVNQSLKSSQSYPRDSLSGAEMTEVGFI